LKLRYMESYSERSEESDVFTIQFAPVCILVVLSFWAQRRIWYFYISNSFIFST